MRLSFRREPAAWIELIKVMIACGMAFGLNVSAEQLAAIVTTLGVIGTLIVRENVYAPTSQNGDRLELVKYEGQPIQSAWDKEGRNP